MPSTSSARHPTTSRTYVNGSVLRESSRGNGIPEHPHTNAEEETPFRWTNRMPERRTLAQDDYRRVLDAKGSAQGEAEKIWWT